MAQSDTADDPAVLLQRALAERDACRDALEASRQREAQAQGDVHHHIRNLLAVIRSIFSRTVETAGTLEHVADHFPGRLNTLARYQSQCALLPDYGIDLEVMFYDELIVAVAANDPRLTIEGPEVRLARNQAPALALAVHELVTNSVKYGMLGGTDERAMLHVGWTLQDGWLEIEWHETGVAIVTAAPIATRFGREYIELALPYQLGAQTRFEIRPGEIRCRIGLTLEAVTASP